MITNIPSHHCHNQITIAKIHHCHNQVTIAKIPSRISSNEAAVLRQLRNQKPSAHWKDRFRFNCFLLQRCLLSSTMSSPVWCWFYICRMLFVLDSFNHGFPVLSLPSSDSCLVFPWSSGFPVQ